MFSSLVLSFSHRNVFRTVAEQRMYHLDRLRYWLESARYFSSRKRDCRNCRSCEVDVGSDIRHSAVGRRIRIKRVALKMRVVRCSRVMTTRTALRLYRLRPSTFPGSAADHCCGCM